MQEIESRVSSHETKLVKIETILERVANNQDSLTESMAEISKSMQKQELLFEKLVNLETNTKSSIDRLHKRIDGTNEKVSDNFLFCNEKFKIIEPILFFIKRPKMFIVLISSCYLITIKEVRDVVFNYFKIFG